jgi:hypothetical protein
MTGRRGDRAALTVPPTLSAAGSPAAFPVLTGPPAPQEGAAPAALARAIGALHPALNHAILAQHDRVRLNRLLARVALYPDDVFDDLASDVLVYPYAPSLGVILEHQPRREDALYLRDGGPRGAYVALRASALAGATHDRVEDLICEALAHGFYDDRVVPLAEVPAGGLALYPFRSKAEVVAFLAEVAEGYVGHGGEVREADILVRLEGFQGRFLNVAHRAAYPLAERQRPFERARAAIVAVVLALLRHGTRAYPAERDPEAQFELSRAQLTREAERRAGAFGRKAAAIAFLRRYLVAQESHRAGLRRLFRDLTRRSVDEFLAALTADQLRAFADLVEQAGA